MGSVSHSVDMTCRERVESMCEKTGSYKQQAGGRGPSPVQVAGETAGTFGSGPGGPDRWGSCGGGGGGGGG